MATGKVLSCLVVKLYCKFNCIMKLIIFGSKLLTYSTYLLTDHHRRNG